MTAPWIPYALQAHLDAAQALVDNGIPFPDSMAAMDLRYHADQVRMGRADRIPGRPYFRQRWQWTDHSVRTLMKNEAAWMDPLHHKSPADRQPVASAPPATQTKAEVEPSSTASPSPARRQRISTRADLHNTHSQEHKNNTPPTPPGGPSVENQTGPVDKSRPAPKPKRKRSTRLTAEAACAVPVPDALAAVDGFREAWDRWVTLRTGKKAWDTAGQVAFILGKLERAHGKGLDVMEGLERAYGSGWVGINPSYLKPLTETRPARSPATLDDLDNLPRRRGRSPLAMTDAERESRAGWTPPPNVALEDRRRWRQEQREEQARRRLRLVAEQEVAK